MVDTRALTVPFGTSREGSDRFIMAFSLFSLLLLERCDDCCCIIFFSGETEKDLVCQEELPPIGEKTRELLVTHFPRSLERELSLVSDAGPSLPSWENPGKLVDDGDGRPLLPLVVLDGEIGVFPPLLLLGESDSSIRAATDPRVIFDVSHCLFWCFS